MLMPVVVALMTRNAETGVAALSIIVLLVTPLTLTLMMVIIKLIILIPANFNDNGKSDMKNNDNNKSDSTDNSNHSCC